MIVYLWPLKVKHGAGIGTKAWVPITPRREVYKCLRSDWNFQRRSAPCTHWLVFSVRIAEVCSSATVQCDANHIWRNIEVSKGMNSSPSLNCRILSTVTSHCDAGHPEERGGYRVGIFIDDLESDIAQQDFLSGCRGLHGVESLLLRKDRFHRTLEWRRLCLQDQVEFNVDVCHASSKSVF